MERIRNAAISACVSSRSSRDILVDEVGKGAWSTAAGYLAQVSTSPASSVVDFEAWPKAGAEWNRAVATLASVVAADRWDIRCPSTTLALAYVARRRLAGYVMLTLQVWGTRRRASCWFAKQAAV